MANSDESQRMEQRSAILRYLAERPHAGDTVEGVLHWWLPYQRRVDAREAIESILEELADEGLLMRTSLPDDTVVYSAAAQGFPEGSRKC